MILISSQFSVAFAETTVVSFDVRVVSDNNGYHDVIFSGKSNAVNMEHEILIRDPDGLLAVIHRIDSDSEGNFEFAFDMDVFKKYGTYTATASAQFELESEGNVATFEKIETELEPIPTDPQLTIYTDKSSYRSGDVISIYGEAGKMTGFVIFLEFYQPNGNGIYFETINVGSDHKYSTEISTEHWEVSGTYTIIGTFPVEGQTETYPLKTTIQFEAVPITVPDTDNDGIDDSVDQCINEEETMNGFEDTDGCPDVISLDDTDNDGIADDSDECPTQAENVNGFEDLDGCPDVIPIVDMDNDGIDDSLDKCPTQSETVNGFEDTDGCPDTVLTPQHPPEQIDRKITICHNPPGNPSNAHTIIVSLSAWPAHKAHGDDRAQCPEVTVQEIAKVEKKSISKWDVAFGLAELGNTKEQNIPKNIDSPLKQNQISISISSDKSTYVDGSIIRIDGNAKNIQPNSMVIVRVYSPSNYNIVDERLFVSDDGNFEIDFDTSDKLWFENGEYVVKVEDRNHNEQKQIKVTVEEPRVEFTAFAQETPAVESASYDDDKLADLIDENKKLREELERQGKQIDDLNEQVDYLSEIIASIQGFFGSIFG